MRWRLGQLTPEALERFGKEILDEVMRLRRRGIWLNAFALFGMGLRARLDPRCG